MPGFPVVGSRASPFCCFLRLRSIVLHRFSMRTIDEHQGALCLLGSNGRRDAAIYRPASGDQTRFAVIVERCHRNIAGILFYYAAAGSGKGTYFACVTHSSSCSSNGPSAGRNPSGTAAWTRLGKQRVEEARRRQPQGLDKPRTAFTIAVRTRTSTSRARTTVSDSCIATLRCEIGRNTFGSRRA